MLAAAGEQYEQSRAFSSAYAPPWAAVSAICASGYAATEMFRRVALRSALAKGGSMVDRRLLHPAPDHRNAMLWRQLAAERIVGAA